MIRVVRIRGFKRFHEVEFRLPGHVVLAGPNNTGKTTVLQAIASWALAFQRWRQLDDFNPRRGYTRAPIARQAFVSVPLGSFDWLWTDRRYRGHVEIELRHDANWSIAMEFVSDSTEQIYVRPRSDTPPETLHDVDLRTVFVPPMTGLGPDEPVYTPPKIEQLLGLGRPGEVLRNLLAQANGDERAWRSLQTSVGKLFGYHLLPPDTSGAHIRAEYTDITGAGLQRLRWRRHEIESYLVHPAALDRFVESLVDTGVATTRIADMHAYMRREFPPGVVDDPLGDHEFLNVTKARTRLLRPLLAAAGIHELPCTRYHEIAELMDPKEVHPEVVEKLDAICRAYGVDPSVDPVKSSDRP